LNAVGGGGRKLSAGHKVLGGTMIHWIESQSTSAIIGIVFSLSYVVAAVVFGFAAALSRRHIAEQLKAISPVTLTPLASFWDCSLCFLPRGSGKMLAAPMNISGKRRAR
jgi:hypothetical protein